MLGAILKKRGETMNNVSQKLFHTEYGNILVSALFGISLAFMFQRVCKGKDCIIIKPPPIEDTKDTIYKIDDRCYKYTPIPVKCDK